MKITLKEVEHIARLARLKLTEEEKILYSEQLSKILDYIEKLNELDTTDVEPTSHVLPIKNVFREDTPEPSLSTDEALKNAPQRAGPYYRVPRIIE
jgi:aspartyl-tRNA(Asn)/glutamyl-tRNA(Gln) amidotransferase subunit C